MKNMILALTLAVTALIASAQNAQTVGGKSIKLDQKNPADVALIRELNGELERMDQQQMVVSQKMTTKGVAVPTVSDASSRAAMVVSSGRIYDDTSLGILAVVHTRIPVGSIIAKRIRYWDGSTRVEGIQFVTEDLMPGYAMGMKNPGGGGYFDDSKQYEFVVLDRATLATTADFISYVTGFGPFIKDSPQVTITNRLRFTIQSDRGAIDAIVINNNTIPKDSYSLEPSPAGTVVVINLNKVRSCIGGGDLPLTVVVGGQSDTTHFRATFEGPQNCRG